MSKKAKGILITCIVMVCLVLLVILGANAYFKLPIATYYLASDKAFVIPGLNKGFVAQGLSYDKANNCYLVCGYMSDDTASPIYWVDGNDETGKTSKKVLLANEDGTPFKGHAGGLTIHGDYIYVAGGNDGCLYVFSYPAVGIANDGDYIGCLGTFPIDEKMSIAFTTSYDDKIVVGEFYEEQDYKTDDSHKLTTTIGEKQNAIAYGYTFSNEKDAILGISPTPCEVYTLPDKAQGMAINDGRIYVSTSYQAAFSHIYSFSIKAATRRGATTAITGESIPLLELDSGTKIDDLKFPPMSEEIEFVDNNMLTMCESASNKYFFGKLTSAKWCYSTDVTGMW